MDCPAIHTGLQASCLLLSGAGDFKAGGPESENSLSGKKLAVGACGPQVPIGGGTPSGKDFFKADCAGEIMARRLATKRPSRLSGKDVLDTMAGV
jgi:S-adenosylmethionine synthetase